MTEEKMSMGGILGKVVNVLKVYQGLVIGGLFCMVCGVYLYLFGELFHLDPFHPVVLEDVVTVAAGIDEELVILDKSGRRLMVTDRDGNLKQARDSRSGGFSSGEKVAVEQVFRM